MRNQDLKTILESLDVPTVRSERRAQIIEKARLAFVHQPALEQERSTTRFWIPITSLASIAFIALLSFGIFREAAPPLASEWRDRVSQSRALIDEVSQLFPAGVRSIVLSNGGTEIVPAEGTPSNSDLVVIEFERNGELFRVIARSGEAVKLLLGSKLRQIEPVVTGRDEVLVSSDDGIWRQNKASTLYGYSVRAQKL